MAAVGIAMAVAMTLLIPTFNALNNSYVQDVPPPPWLPTPDDIPDDFKPPTDFVPPSNWQPPEGWEPPPDWEPPEGWEPPPGYEGPPPNCPPPVLREVNLTPTSWTLRATGPASSTMRFEIPEFTIGFLLNITMTQNWGATRLDGHLDVPEGAKDWDAPTRQAQAGSLLFTPTNPAFEWQYNSTEVEERYSMPAGDYALTLSAQNPTGGTFRAEGVMLLACGGMLS